MIMLILILVLCFFSVAGMIVDHFTDEDAFSGDSKKKTKLKQENKELKNRITVLENEKLELQIKVDGFELGLPWPSQRVYDQIQQHTFETVEEEFRKEFPNAGN